MIQIWSLWTKGYFSREPPIQRKLDLDWLLSIFEGDWRTMDYNGQKKLRLSDLILCSTHHQSFQICSISVWLEGSFKGPQFTFLCDVVGQSRVAKVAAGLIISSQGQKMSRWILDAPAVPEIKSNDILCTIAFGIDNKIGSICWHLGLWAGHWQARLPESCAAKYLSEIRRYSCGKAVPMRGVLRIDMML